MKQIKIPFHGELIYKTEENLTDKQLQEKAIECIVVAEVRANAIGDFRVHISNFDLKEMILMIAQESPQSVCDVADEIVATVKRGKSTRRNAGW